MASDYDTTDRGAYRGLSNLQAVGIERLGLNDIADPGGIRRMDSGLLGVLANPQDGVFTKRPAIDTPAALNDLQDLSRIIRMLTYRDMQGFARVILAGVNVPPPVLLEDVIGALLSAAEAFK